MPTNNAQNGVVVSFLDRSGNLPELSGLNWGQRFRRDHNQAYIRLPASVYRSGFFPVRGAQFILQTDDGQSILCARRQDYGKAIHSIQSNSILGQYFRDRLGVLRGEKVTKAHLEKYGRTDVIFHKIDDNTYRMDFSVPRRD